MLRMKMLLRFAVSAVVLTIAGVAVSGGPHTAGPVQEMAYDETTDVVLGLPNGLAPVSSYQGALKKGVAQPADLSTYPPNPCLGVSSVWNAILSDPSLHGHAQKKALVVSLQVMATLQCGLQIVRDESTSPPTIVSITPISTF